MIWKNIRSYFKRQSSKVTIKDRIRSRLNISSDFDVNAEYWNGKRYIEGRELILKAPHLYFTKKLTDDELMLVNLLEHKDFTCKRIKGDLISWYEGQWHQVSEPTFPVVMQRMQNGSLHFGKDGKDHNGERICSVCKSDCGQCG